MPVPTHALLPEEFQSDSESLQYGDLLESGKADKFNKMVEADNKLEEVDQKLEKEGSRLIEGKKKSLNKFINILQEQEKIQKNAVKKEAKFDKAIESDKSLAKKNEPNEQDIDREFDGLLDQHGFGIAYTMIENRHGRTPAFQMLKRKYGPAEAGKLFKEQLDVKMKELAESKKAAAKKKSKDKNLADKGIQGAVLKILEKSLENESLFDSTVRTLTHKKNEKNKPPTFQEALDKWSLRSPDESGFHRQGPGNENNLVFDAPNGHGEVVFRPDGTLVTDPRNMASYNLARKEDWLGHVTKDIIPYVLYGNSPDDPSTPGERLILAMDEFRKFGIRGLGRLNERTLRKIERMIKGKIAFKSRKEGAIAAGVSRQPPFSRNRK